MHLAAQAASCPARCMGSFLYVCATSCFAVHLPTQKGTDPSFTNAIARLALIASTLVHPLLNAWSHSRFSGCGCSPSPPPLLMAFAADPVASASRLPAARPRRWETGGQARRAVAPGVLWQGRGQAAAWGAVAPLPAGARSAVHGLSMGSGTVHGFSRSEPRAPSGWDRPAPLPAPSSASSQRAFHPWYDRRFPRPHHPILVPWRSRCKGLTGPTQPRILLSTHLNARIFDL